MDTFNDKICIICSYYRFHVNESVTPLNHFTCLCGLFGKRYICCKKGSTNLLTKIPNIVIYWPIPEVINSSYINIVTNYLPTNKTILETLNFGFNQKIEVLHSHSILFSDHPYF